MTRAEDAAPHPSRRRLLAGALVLLAGPLVALVLAVRSADNPVQRVDHRLAASLHTMAIHHPAYTRAMQIVSDIGSVLWWVILVPVAAWLAYRARFRLAAFVLVSAVGSVALNRAVKHLVGRPRPTFLHPVSAAGGWSFPSGHAQAAVVGVIILGAVVPSLARRPVPAAVLVVVALLIAYSRIALGMHYLSDLVGSLVLGAAWMLVSSSIFTPWTSALPSRRTVT